MSSRPIIFSSTFKRQNFLYYAGVLLSNCLMYMILVRVLQFYLAGELPFAFTVKVLLGQVVLWSILKIIRVEKDDSQQLSSHWFVLGGLLGGLLGSVVQSRLGLPNILALAFFSAGHIFFQNIFWTELSTSSPSDKKFMGVRVMVMAFCSFLVYLTDFKNPALMAWCGLMVIGHVFVRSLATGMSQTWLVYHEEVLFKSHYHQIVKTHHVQHIASDSSQTMRSSFINHIVFIMGSIGVGLLTIGLMATDFVKTAYKLFVDVFVGILEWLLGDLMKAFLDFLVNAQQNVKPQEQKPAGTIAKEFAQKAQATPDLARQEEAANILMIILGVVVVGIILIALMAMAKKQVKRLQRQMLTNQAVGRSHFENNTFMKRLIRAFDVKAHLKQGQIDLYRKKYKKLIEGFVRGGMAVAHSNTPSELVEKMICYLPEERDALLRVTEVYITLRYGEVQAPSYHETMTELNRLIKQVRKGVKVYDKKIESGRTHSV